MGPAQGPSEILTTRRRSSPFFAALVNGAASHFVEQDDLHNSSVLHPGTVVFPAVLAAGQHAGISGKALIAAAVAGYECGVRVGEFLGRSHYRIFHTTGTAGKLAAAAGVGARARARRAADAGLPRLGGDDGRGLVGIPARRGGFEAAAHRESRGRRPDGRLHRARRFHRREADPRRRAGHGRGHVERRRPALAHRRARHALGARRNVVQVPRVVPPHASRRRTRCSRSCRSTGSRPTTSRR